MNVNNGLDIFCHSVAESAEFLLVFSVRSVSLWQI